jgi:hypothetical protein
MIMKLKTEVRARAGCRASGKKRRAPITFTVAWREEKEGAGNKET